MPRRRLGSGWRTHRNTQTMCWDTVRLKPLDFIDQRHPDKFNSKEKTPASPGVGSGWAGERVGEVPLPAAHVCSDLATLEGFAESWEWESTRKCPDFTQIRH